MNCFSFAGKVRQQLVDRQARERELRRGFHPVTGEAGGLKVTGERRAWHEGPLLGARVFREPWEWYAVTWFHTTYARYPSTSFFLSPQNLRCTWCTWSGILSTWPSSTFDSELHRRTDRCYRPVVEIKTMWRITFAWAPKYPTTSESQVLAYISSLISSRDILEFEATSVWSASEYNHLNHDIYDCYDIKVVFVFGAAKYMHISWIFCKRKIHGFDYLWGLFND